MAGANSSADNWKENPLWLRWSGLLPYLIPTLVFVGLAAASQTEIGQSLFSDVWNELKLVAVALLVFHAYAYFARRFQQQSLRLTVARRMAGPIQAILAILDATVQRGDPKWRQMNPSRNLAHGFHHWSQYEVLHGEDRPSHLLIRIPDLARRYTNSMTFLESHADLFSPAELDAYHALAHDEFIQLALDDGEVMEGMPTFPAELSHDEHAEAYFGPFIEKISRLSAALDAKYDLIDVPASIERVHEVWRLDRGRREFEDTFSVPAILDTAATWASTDPSP